MDQAKIGKFIEEKRKEKKLTQKELAEKLGVTDRAISKWENGRGMPDVSLLKSLSKELDISLAELLSGENLNENEESIVLEEKVIDVQDSKNKLKNDVVGYLLLKFIGIFILYVCLCFYGVDGYWMNILLISGFGFLMASSYKLIRNWNKVVMIIYLLIVFCIISGIYKFIEYSYIDNGDLSKPYFYYSKVEKNNCTIYKTLFYDCYRNKNYEYEECMIIDDYLWDLYHFNVNSEEELLNSKYCSLDYDYKKDCELYHCEMFNEN